MSYFWIQPSSQMSESGFQVSLSFSGALIPSLHLFCSVMLPISSPASLPCVPPCSALFHLAFPPFHPTIGNATSCNISLNQTDSNMAPGVGGLVLVLLHLLLRLASVLAGWKNLEYLSPQCPDRVSLFALTILHVCTCSCFLLDSVSLSGVSLGTGSRDCVLFTHSSVQAFYRYL